MQSQTEMYLDRIQSAVDFIEANIGKSLTFQDVARTVAFSPYHFHRVFKTLVGETVTDYIRMRQLSEAAKELITTNRRILDIAIDYQFGSQAAFNRAFKRVYNVTPLQYRKTGRPHVLLEKRVLTQESLGHRCQQVTLVPKITTLPGFWVTGMEYRGQNQNNEIPDLWAQFLARIQEIPARINKDLVLGVCEVLVPYTQDSMFSYLAGAMADQNSLTPTGMKQIYVPNQTYAVFTHTGSPDLLDHTYQYIYGSWLLKSDYELVPSHDFEWYDHRFNSSREDSEMEIYIPVSIPLSPAEQLNSCE